MKASIIIPTRNRFYQLTNLLQSLLPQIIVNKLENRVEIIIVDDCSVDATKQKTMEFLDELNFNFVRKFFLAERRGPSYARNFGVGQSEGEIIIFLDDDLTTEKNFIAATLREHDAHPDQMVIVGDLKKLRDDFCSNYWFVQYDAAFNREKTDFYQVNLLSAGHFSIKRRLLNEATPLFDELLPSREDYDLYLRLEEKGIAVFKSNNVVAYNDCRHSFLGLMKQYMWYAKGQYHLKRKYGAEFIARREPERRFSLGKKGLLVDFILRKAVMFTFYREQFKYERSWKNGLRVLDALVSNRVLSSVYYNLKRLVLAKK